MKNPIFEVNESDIEALNDEDLTELVARLCRADVTRADQSTSCVKHGGDINTPDDGLDIVVEWIIDPPNFSHLPRKTTGIQIKKTDMYKSRIITEMQKNIGKGKSINRLVDKKGAYVIVSSGQSCNHRQLSDREDAMSKAVTPIANNEDLRLVFYDTQAIVNWVNEYPGVIIWVRNTVGRPLSGWQPFSDWSNSGVVNDYFLDDKLRIMSDLLEKGATVIDGIQIIRRQLFIPGSSVRLVGLSGVGKTRLIQALFESSVGVDPLPNHLACYTDSADNPIPDAVELIRVIKANDQRIILIIDNCSGELHNNLVKNIEGSQISLITVEYDVQEDLPMKTNVFLLEPASEKVLKEVLTTRHPDIDKIVLDRIVDLSEGNSRVALALVDNFINFGNFGTLRDKQIFERLFLQRNSESRELLNTAQACSLVFSFNSSDPGDEESEIPLLALLQDQNSEVFYRNINEIKRRKLLQSRGDMSAILPQAVANRLAINSLDSYTKGKLASVFLGQKSSRLLMSFCHRLSYLHESPKAREIAKNWLSHDGLFGDLGLRLDISLRRDISYLFPLDFEVSMKYLERLVELSINYAVDDQFSWNVNWIVESLLDLAYYEENFEFALSLIEQILVMDKTGFHLERRTQEQIYSLFWPRFSKTLASPLIRHTHISSLIKSNNQRLNDLGVKFLNSALQTSDLTFFFPADFGARPLTLGYEIKSVSEMKQWIVDSLFILSESLEHRPDMKESLLSVIERQFRSLWNLGIVCDELTDFIKNITSYMDWSEIWVEVKETLFYTTSMTEPRLEKLNQLEQITRPSTMVQETRIFLKKSDLFRFFANNVSEIEGPTTWRSEYEKKMKDLGTKVAKNLEVINEIGPELFTYENYWISPFVESLTCNSDDRVLLWQTLRDVYKKAQKGRTPQILILFFKTLWGLDTDLSESIKNEVLEDPELCELFPFTINPYSMTPSDISAILEKINAGESSSVFLWGVSFLPIGNSEIEPNYCDLLRIVSKTRFGYERAIEILAHNFDNAVKKNLPISQSLLDTGRELLMMANNPDLVYWNDPMPDIYLASILKTLMKNGVNASYMKTFIDGLFPENFQSSSNIGNHPSIDGILGQNYPLELLDTLFSRIGLKDTRKELFLYYEADKIGKIIQCVDAEVILKWMSCDLIARAQFLSRFLSLIIEDKDQSIFKWSEFGNIFLSLTYDIPFVLDNIIFRQFPRGWIGDFSLTLRKYLPLFDSDLFTKTKVLENWRDTQRSQLLSDIQKHEESEAKDRNRSQEFE